MPLARNSSPHSSSVTVRRVLHRVVQVDLVQVMKALAAFEFVKVHRQRGRVINAAITPGRPLQMDADVFILRLTILGDRAADILAVLLAELVELLLADLDLDLRNHALLEEDIAGIRLRRR